MTFPSNAITINNYQLTGNGTTTIINLPDQARLLYFQLEKPAVNGEIKIYADGAIIGHLDGLEKHTLTNTNFKKIELVRDQVSGESFATFVYTQATTTPEVVAQFSYGDIFTGSQLFIITSILLYSFLWFSMKRLKLKTKNQ